MSDLSPESRALFRGAREDMGPSADDRARIERALAIHVGVVAGTIAATTSTASASVAPGAAGTATVAVSSTAALATKWIAAVALVGGLGAGGVSTYRAATAPPATHVAVASPQAPIAAKSVPIATPSPTPIQVPTPTPTAIPIAVRAPAPPPKAAGSVADETRLLRDADAALREGDAVRALALLDDHARAYPNGVLAEERSVERIFALCKLGRVAEARAQVGRFLRVHPDSPLADSVRASCGHEP